MSLSYKQKDKIRRDFSSKQVSVNYLKGELNAVIDAIDAWWDLPSTKLSINNAIESATSFSFTILQKKQIGGMWMKQKFGSEVS